MKRLMLIPVLKEVVEERDEVPLFRRQVADGLYKIWPTKPMAAGEYAVIQFTEGEVNWPHWTVTLAWIRTQCPINSILSRFKPSLGYVAERAAGSGQAFAQVTEHGSHGRP